jgi:hypothetical protein
MLRIFSEFYFSQGHPFVMSRETQNPKKYALPNSMPWSSEHRYRVVCEHDIEGSYSLYKIFQSLFGSNAYAYFFKAKGVPRSKVYIFSRLEENGGG